MQYPTLKSGSVKSLYVKALSGGCNRRDRETQVADSHLSLAENVWYQDGVLCTRPGFRSVSEQKQDVSDVVTDWKFCAEDTVSGTAQGRRFLRRVYHTAENTVSFQTGLLTYDGRLVFEGGMEGFSAGTTGMLMEYPYTDTENVIIFLSTGAIYAQNSTTGAWRRVDDEAYVPCIRVDMRGVLNLESTPSYGGRAYEGRNMLTGNYRVKYTISSDSFIFYLPFGSMDESHAVTIDLVNYDGSVAHYVIGPNETEAPLAANGLRPVLDRQRGRFYFEGSTGCIVTPPLTVPNSMTVSAYKEWSAAEKQRISTMQFSTWFGGTQAGGTSRQFISGSPLSPSRIYWSGQGQPLYFPETQYITVGDINQAVTAFGKQDGVLMIFKEREIYSLSKPDGLVSMDTVDGHLVQEETATCEYFPLTQIHGQIGCMAPQTLALCGNRLLWADGLGGVYALLHGSAYNGFSVRKVSGLISPQLADMNAADWKKASGALYEGYYLLHSGTAVYALRLDENAFGSYARSGDDGTAQQKFGWFIWKLKDGTFVTRLFGNGRQAVALARTTDVGSDEVELPEVLADGMADRGHGAIGREIPISARIVTKAYALAENGRFCRLIRVHVGLQTAADTVVRFGYRFDGREAGDAVILREGPFDGVCRLTPNCIRVHRAGLCLETVGNVAVDSVCFIYRS